MGLQFDWEVEDSEPAPRLDAETPDAAGRDNRVRRLIGWGMVAVVLAVAAYSMVRWQKHRIDERLHQELEAAVAAELTALRIGDKKAFEKLQTGSENWISIQRQTFERYQQGASAYQYLTADISQMEIEAGQGTVHVPGLRDGQPFCVVWRYDYTRDGWQHVDSPPTLCGSEAQHLEGQHVAFDTYSADTAYSQDLLDRIDRWLDVLCALTDCSSYPRRLTVRVLPDISGLPRWEDETTLVIPSPALIPAAGRPSDFDSLLRDRLSEYWTQETLSTAAPGAVRSRWMQSNLRDLALAAWETDPTDTYLGRLADQYGADIVRGLLTDWAVGQTSNELLADVVGPKMGRGTGDLWATFEILLQTEAVLMQSGDEEAATAYRDPEREFPEAWWDPFPVNADPASIRVASIFQTEFNDEINWAEVYWQYSPNAPFLYGSIHAVQSKTYIPFRQVEGRWARTLILPDDHGPPREITRDDITVAYRADDEQLAEPLLAALAEMYPRLAADVGLDPVPPVRLLLTPSTAEYIQWSEQGPAPSPESIGLAAISSYEWCCSAGKSLEQTIIDRTKYQLVVSVVNVRVSSLTQSDILGSAFANRFARQYGLIDEFPLEAVYRDRLAFDSDRSTVSDLPSSLTQLWLDLKLDIPSSGETVALSTGVLVDVLMDTYGPEAMQPLLASVDEADTLDDWLMMSVGATVAEVEPLWQARMDEVVTDIQAEALVLREALGTP